MTELKFFARRPDPPVALTFSPWVSLAHFVPLRAHPGQKPGFFIQTKSTPDFSVRQLSITPCSMYQTEVRFPYTRHVAGHVLWCLRGKIHVQNNSIKREGLSCCRAYNIVPYTTVCYFGPQRELTVRRKTLAHQPSRARGAIIVVGDGSRKTTNRGRPTLCTHYYAVNTSLTRDYPVD